jgi:hypothetical protein
METHGESMNKSINGLKLRFNSAYSVSPCEKLIEKYSVQSVRHLAMYIKQKFFLTQRTQRRRKDR